jgi:hypothetical protein
VRVTHRRTREERPGKNVGISGHGDLVGQDCPDVGEFRLSGSGVVDEPEGFCIHELAVRMK